MNYLFWNTIYKIGDKSYEAFFATGNGGNKIFIFKDHPLVVVITATAFGQWYMHRQAHQIMEWHILPAVFNDSHRMRIPYVTVRWRSERRRVDAAFFSAFNRGEKMIVMASLVLF